MNLPRLIGVIHLPALPGAPGAPEKHPSEILQAAGLRAIQEAQLLEQAGFEGIILENFGDLPFFKTEVPPETVASLSIIAAAVREAVQIPIGINVLRNDARAALAIASVTACDFIRINVLSGVAATDQGWIEGDAAWVARERKRLHSSVKILADVHVKHAITFSSSDLEIAIEEAGLRACADGVIITGRTTGRKVHGEALQIASRVARKNRIPLYLGSGVSRENLAELRPYVDGMIVGSDLRSQGRAGATLDPKRTKEFAKLFKSKLKKKAKRVR